MSIPDKSHFAPSIAAILGAVLFVAAPASAESPRFIRVGNTYRLTVAAHETLPGNVVKIMVDGGAGWIQAQCFLCVVRNE
jgi:hypothetical protein